MSTKSDYTDEEWAVAQETANHEKEGGFLGIGGEQVSDREHEMLSRLGTALAVDTV